MTAIEDPAGAGRLVLSGGRLEDVLAEVDASFGAEVDIVRVDRSIVGGIAGFFGREQFEVEVALAGAAAPSAVVPNAVVPDAVPGAAPGAVAPDAVPGAAPGAVAPSAPPEAAAPSAPPEAAAPTATNGASFAAALQEALDQIDQIDHGTPGAPEPMPAYVVVEDPLPEVRPVEFEHIAVPAPVPAPASAPAPAPAAVLPTGVVSPASGSGSLLSLLAGAMSLDELTIQVQDLAIAAPSTLTGGVVAVAGDGDEALVVAESLAIAGGGCAGDVIVMAPAAMPGRPSWMCLTSPEQAASRRTVWQDSGRLVVVAVVVTPGAQGQEWGRAALDALDPDQTRLAVPGWRRPEEVAGRLAAMAPVHAIDLVGAIDAAAAVDYLDLAVPVATIDGVPATPRRWAEMVLAAVPTAAVSTAAAPTAAVSTASTDRPTRGTVADDPILAAVLLAAAEEHAR